MKVVKTSELVGEQLDMAVSMANKEPTTRAYTSDWRLAGPLLQRHISELIDCGEGGWEACCDGFYGATGTTALEAICKAYVRAKIGEEVILPQSMINNED